MTARAPRIARLATADGLRDAWRDHNAAVTAALPIVALIGLVAYFAARSPTFLTLSNLTVMSGQAGPLLLVSLGATLVVVMGSIDLSVGSVALLAGAVAAWLLANTGAGLWAIALALLVGAGCGLANGAIFAYGRIPSFVVTLGSLSILSGIALTILEGSPIPFVEPGLSDLTIGRGIPHIQNVGLWALAAWVLLALVGLRTRLGLGLYAIGGEERVARLSGIPVNRYKVYAFVLSGVTAAAAGVMAVGQLGSGGPSVGSSFLLDSLAAIVVAGTPLSGGVGGVHRTLLGVLLITILGNGLNQVGVGEYTQQVITGSVIIGAVLITMAAHRRLVVK